MERDAGNKASSAENALRVVQLMSQRGHLQVREVANALGVADSTAHRLLTVCRRTGYVRQDSAGGPYLPGPVLHEIALATNSSTTLRAAAGELAKGAAAELDETVSIAILEGRQCRFVESFEGTRPMRVPSLLGLLFPAHATSAGRAILARFDAPELERRFPTKLLERRTHRTITEWSAFLSELDRTRKRGWAIEFEETEPGIASVSRVLVDSAGAPKAAICVTVPMTRLSTAREALPIANVLSAVAAKVQSRLFSSSDPRSTASPDA